MLDYGGIGRGWGKGGAEGGRRDLPHRFAGPSRRTLKLPTPLLLFAAVTSAVT